MLGREVTELSWQDARLDVQQVNPELAAIIDEINPDKRYTLIKASYAFGDLIINDGIVQLPTKEGLLSPINDLTCDNKLKNKLNYSAIPLLLTLKKSNEVFIDTGNRIIPLNLFKPGSLLGLFESTDFIFNRNSTPSWCVSAGARSIFVLPKITESLGFKRLRMHYGLSSSTKLLHISDHWNVFSSIANHKNFSQPWQNEILFFTEGWLMPRHDDPHWTRFHHYLFKHAWQQAQFAIGKIELGLYWEAFVDAISTRNLKPTPYLADQVKHIMAIAVGRWPAFRAADDSQSIAPTDGLQQALIEIYLLKQHLPTIMHAQVLNGNNLPLYYSLYYPTLLEGSPINKSTSTLMIDLREIKLLIDTYKQNNSQHRKFKNPMLEEIEFEYFHVEPDMYQEIQSSKLIPQLDESFLQGHKSYNNHSFCATSSFWRGCIKIAKKPNNTYS